MRKQYSFALPMISLFVFSLAAFVVPDQEFESIMDDFLSQRTNIMQSVIDDALTYEEGEAALSVFESDPLLAQDLNAMVNWDETCYDRISGFQINRCQVVNENEIGIVLLVAVTWEMYDMEGEYTLPEEYLFVLEKGQEEGKWKLCEMKLRSKTNS